MRARWTFVPIVVFAATACDEGAMGTVPPSAKDAAAPVPDVLWVDDVPAARDWLTWAGREDLVPRREPGGAAWQGQGAVWTVSGPPDAPESRCQIAVRRWSRTDRVTADGHARPMLVYTPTGVTEARGAVTWTQFRLDPDAPRWAPYPPPAKPPR